ncbi:M15 family metallopeptidase [Actinopolymorpha sp. B17G11]|uniref:M15 family metallopeptidase n=1 Tax=Actinopolymorpha sp. B17G11 TaxID=3160861 RepID=UPI0032E4C3C3
MAYSEPARTPARRTRSTILAALIVALVTLSATLFGVLICQSLASSSGAAQPTDAAATDTPSAAADRQRRPMHPRGDHRPALGDRDVADGAVPGGVTIFEDEFPAVANLDPDLLAALRQAAAAAADDGVEFHVKSGWRTPAYQDQLLREAISEYGSEEEAARWVATADTSPHVSGDAIDIGPSDATTWLSEHGAEYGLCQIYRNEPWHYELRPEAIDDGCPPRYADPTHDPRMRQ